MTTRVLIGSIKQETNGFNRHLTPLSAFQKQGLHVGEGIFKAFGDANLELGGFIEVGRAQGWDLIPSIAAIAPPAGPVADEAFEYLCGALIDSIKAALPLDGVLLALHGSMVVVSYPDAEHEITRRVREAVGNDVLVMTSLDPHCNISSDMAGVVDGMFAFRTSPHIDQRQTGIYTATMLARAFERGDAPTVVLERRPMLIGFDGARTYHDHGPMRDAIELAQGYERDPDILGVSIHAGYSKADCAMVGPSVAVTGYASRERLREIAAAMMDECWAKKDITSERIVSIDEAMKAVRAHRPGDRPVVLGDYGDSPGGGGYGDGTALLQALIDARTKNAVVMPIYEPESVALAVQAGVGSSVKLALGGKNEPSKGGGPIELEWRVVSRSDGEFRYTGPYGTGTTGTFGECVVLEHDGVQAVVTSIHKGIYDQAQLRVVGIEPSEKSVLVLKSMQGYRGDFQAMASICLDVDSGGITSPDPSRFDWKNVQRPVWPLDDVQHQ